MWKPLEAVQRGPAPPNVVRRSREAHPEVPFPVWCDGAISNSVAVPWPAEMLLYQISSLPVGGHPRGLVKTVSCSYTSRL